MARHANNLDFLLNPGRPSETDADERKEDQLRDGDDEDGDVTDASPSNKIALAFILDTPQEALERKSEVAQRVDTQTDYRPGRCGLLLLQHTLSCTARPPASPLTASSVGLPLVSSMSIETSNAIQQQDGGDENDRNDNQDPDGNESEEKEDAAGAAPRQVATTQARAAASRANKASRVSISSPTTGGTPTNRKVRLLTGCRYRSQSSTHHYLSCREASTASSRAVRAAPSTRDDVGSTVVPRLS